MKPSGVDGALLMTADRDDSLNSTVSNKGGGGLYRVRGTPTGNDATDSSKFVLVKGFDNGIQLERIDHGIPCAKMLAVSGKNPHLVYVSTGFDDTEGCPAAVGQVTMSSP